jgi:phosphate transport system permease protein
MLLKGNIDADLPESSRRISDSQINFIKQLQEQKIIESKFNTTLFTSGDSRESEQAGILGALVGSALMLSITFMIAFPLGVAAAIYLEEFAPKNRFIDFIEVNINNLAAVPSIIYGLLGLAVFINYLGMPRSAPLVGGLVLALMTFPVVIIASRASLQSVPPSIRDAALGVGASKIQTIFDHILPLALPGILTGSIIGMARALGESAPLIMIGMVAFVVDIPSSPLESSAALPVQVYLWADSPERGFVEKTSAAIMVLLAFLLLMNSLAIWLRNKYEIKW